MLSCFDEILRTCKTETGIEINLGKSVSSVLLSRTAANVAIDGDKAVQCVHCTIGDVN